MSPPHTSSLKTPLSITHIDTACAIIHLDGVNLITDPVFSSAGTTWDVGITVLKKSSEPGLSIPQLPPIDAVLLSHEDHPDNLDELGRALLDARRVLTTPDGASKLAPRPGVQALHPWETVSLNIGGRHFSVTGTPCKHLPGGEVTGFILTAPEFGQADDGRPNAIYFSGDTFYLEELAQMRERFHIAVALLNIGRASVLLPDAERTLQITMDGTQAARLFRDIGADILVPMHFEAWAHFTETADELKREFEAEGVQDRVVWLQPGVETRIV
ncbi:beta-lactamase superfamily domain-containing protein [Bombardia bombarda]|uniref:Beta-lactamase superfamily domain-containing protein n=1 Tax=Bombardia bombarda TaxID=252184 RepID=A0AA39X7Z0_9PEZI|nr:beta-lactamase superfamily domain-containing protein [Bombardia bombarda]